MTNQEIIESGFMPIEDTTNFLITFRSKKTNKLYYLKNLVITNEAFEDTNYIHYYLTSMLEGKTQNFDNDPRN